VVTAILFGAQMELAQDLQEEYKQEEHQIQFVRHAKKLDLL
jgi:hypothetical protein